MPPSFEIGIFVISLDFELYWGVRDKRTLQGYGENIWGTREAVLGMLSLFAEYQVHATWSTVGFLFLDGREALVAHLPDRLPGYTDQNLCPYHYLQHTEQLPPQAHFAPDLIDLIAASPGQEVGTHTFSHYYCLEPGATGESFRADLTRAREAALARGIQPRSLVFPRNQWREDFLAHLQALEICCFRGVEDHPIYRATEKAEQSLPRRALRLLDSYLNLTGHHTFGPAVCGHQPPYNLPASRFLRPYNKRLCLLDGLKKRRIVSGMRHAAQNRQAYHLWWHPHNFGKNLKQNLDFLARILDEYRSLSDRYGFRSMNMAELAQAIPNL